MMWNIQQCCMNRLTQASVSTSNHFLTFWVPNINKNQQWNSQLVFITWGVCGFPYFSTKSSLNHRNPTWQEAFLTLLSHQWWNMGESEIIRQLMKYQYNPLCPKKFKSSGVCQKIYISVLGCKRHNTYRFCESQSNSNLRSLHQIPKSYTKSCKGSPWQRSFR
jgi:hypothetical protein